MGKNWWADLPLAQKDQLASLYSSGNRELLEAEVERLKLPVKKMESLERMIRSYNMIRNQIMREVASQIQFPESPTPRYIEYDVIPADDAIVISDLELPDYSVEMMQYALLTGMKYGIRRLIIAGDFLATDQHALNAWVDTWRRQNELTYRNAVKMSVVIIREALKWFTHIDMIEGNHDDRIARATQGEVFLGWLLEGTGVNYSQYEYMYLKTTNRGYIKICHPTPGSQASVGLGQQIYNSEDGPDPNNPTKCHIVLGHTHLAQAGWSPDGLFEIIALGCMRDPLRTKYKQKKASKFHKWINGFLMIKNGYFYPLTRYGTDWKTFLGDLYEAKDMMPTPQFQMEMGRMRKQVEAIAS